METEEAVKIWFDVASRKRMPLSWLERIILSLNCTKGAFPLIQHLLDSKREHYEQINGIPFRQLWVGICKWKDLRVSDFNGMELLTWLISIANRRYEPYHASRGVVLLPYGFKPTNTRGNFIHLLAKHLHVVCSAWTLATRVLGANTRNYGPRPHPFLGMVFWRKYVFPDVARQIIDSWKLVDYHPSICKAGAMELVRLAEIFDDNMKPAYKSSIHLDPLKYRCYQLCLEAIGHCEGTVRHLSRIHIRVLPALLKNSVTFDLRPDTDPVLLTRLRHRLESLVPSNYAEDVVRIRYFIVHALSPDAASSPTSDAYLLSHLISEYATNRPRTVDQVLYE